LAAIILLFPDITDETDLQKAVFVKIQPIKRVSAMRGNMRYTFVFLAAGLLCRATLAVADEQAENTQTENRPVFISSAIEQSDESIVVQDYPTSSPCEDCICNSMKQTCRTWTIDYRVSSMFCSRTVYEFGTGPGGQQYAPLSRLNWSLDSVWHGLQVGIEKPNYRVHFEWLTPMDRKLSGEMSDYDWEGPDSPPDSLSTSPERWQDGQRIDLGGEFKLTNCFFNMPIEIWPTAGFRFQRFGMMSYDGVQVVNNGGDPDTPPVGYRWHGSTISSNQQYYMGYFGGQLRTELNLANVRKISLTFQGDWAATAGYNVDHHISGYEKDGVHRYGYDSTHGGTIHLALIAETPFYKRFNIGVQADHTEVRTTGSHRFYEYGTRHTDETWSDGVKVNSDQNSLTAFIRGRF
jgi:hypothetical protein